MKWSTRRSRGTRLPPRAGSCGPSGHEDRQSRRGIGPFVMLGHDVRLESFPDTPAAASRTTSPPAILVFLQVLPHRLPDLPRRIWTRSPPVLPRPLAWHLRLPAILPRRLLVHPCLQRRHTQRHLPRQQLLQAPDLAVLNHRNPPAGNGLRVSLSPTLRSLQAVLRIVVAGTSNCRDTGRALACIGSFSTPETEGARRADEGAPRLPRAQSPLLATSLREGEVPSETPLRVDQSETVRMGALRPTKSFVPTRVA